MPFDPTKPANNSPASSAEMRSQLTSLNADIQQQATAAQVAATSRIPSSKRATTATA